MAFMVSDKSVVNINVIPMKVIIPFPMAAFNMFFLSAV